MEKCEDCGKEYKTHASLMSHRRHVHGIYLNRRRAPKVSEATMVIGAAPERVRIIIANGTKETTVDCYLLAFAEVVDAVAGGVRGAVVHKGIKL